jgi:hypothetical protein
VRAKGKLYGQVQINLKQGGRTHKNFGNVVLWTHDGEPRDDETCDHIESDEKVRSYLCAHSI